MTRRDERAGDAPGGEQRPRSALNLRLALAIFGLLVCGVAGGFALVWGFVVAGVVLAVLAFVAVIDIGVVSWRKAQRSRRDDGYSLFE